MGSAPCQATGMGRVLQGPAALQGLPEPEHLEAALV